MKLNVSPKQMLGQSLAETDASMNGSKSLKAGGVEIARKSGVCCCTQKSLSKI